MIRSVVGGLFCHPFVTRLSPVCHPFFVFRITVAPPRLRFPVGVMSMLGVKTVGPCRSPFACDAFTAKDWEPLWRMTMKVR